MPLLDGGPAASLIDVSWGAATHTGRVRQNNEDALLAQPPVFVVADGMGGHDAGEIASEIAIRQFRRFAGLSSVAIEDVAPAIAAANDAIVAAGEALPGYAGMGSTVVGLIAVEQHGAPYWFAFNVGDSRLYRFCRGELTQISVDHSHVQELVALGKLSREDARDHPDRNVITRVLGQQSSSEPDYWLLPPAAGERFVLCSDGLSGDVDTDQMGAVLLATPDPSEAAESLLAAALAAGGRDNITVVVVDVHGVDTSGALETTTPRGGFHRG